MISTRKYKVKLVARPNSSNVTAQPLLTNPKTQVNSEGQKSSTEGTPENNPPPLENTLVHASTPWAEAEKMSGNLYELRKDWLIPPTNNTVTDANSKPHIKIEPQAKEQPPPCAAAPQKVEQCGWGLNCPICKIIEEDWDGEHQKELQQNTKTLKCKMHNRRIPSRSKMHTNLKLRTPSILRPRTTRCHKTPSTPGWNDLTY